MKRSDRSISVRMDAFLSVKECLNAGEEQNDLVSLFLASIEGNKAVCRDLVEEKKVDVNSADAKGTFFLTLTLPLPNPYPITLQLDPEGSYFVQNCLLRRSQNHKNFFFFAFTFVQDSHR